MGTAINIKYTVYNRLFQLFINKNILLFLSVALTIGFTIYSVNDKPTDTPVETTTDIDWQNPPCNPDDLSNDWKEVTDPRMLAGSNRREFQYKNTNTKIAFEKGNPLLKGESAKDHWHRYNPIGKNHRDLYLDAHGNVVQRGAPTSHIKPNCK